MSTEYLKQIGIEEVIRQFAMEGKLLDAQPYGNGHINDTYLLTFGKEQVQSIVERSKALE